jgi:hypothetical protein
MTKKHTTAMGMPFDMAALRAKNEKVRAVGNMNVNARGDIIDSNNNVVNDSNKRVNVMYNRITQYVPASKQHATPAPRLNSSETTADELNDLDDDIPNPKK